jgi:tetratricopeptide (TPR) repeat protein
MSNDTKNEEKVKKLFLLAYHEHQNEKHDEAEKFYKKILKIDPNQADALNNLASIFFMKKKFKLTLKYLKRLCKQHPQYIEGLNNIARTYAEIQDIPKAIEYYKKALEIDPSNENTLILIGTLFLKVNEATKAINCFRFCSESHPNSALAFNNLATALEGQKQFPEALKAAKKAFEIEPENEMFHIHEKTLKIKQQQLLEKNEKPPERP